MELLLFPIFRFFPYYCKKNHFILYNPMNNQIEYYLQQLNSPVLLKRILNSKGTPSIRNMILSCQELSGSQMTVKQLSRANCRLWCLAINGMSSLYLCCVFRHPCVYRGNTYIIPLELIIPQFFPQNKPMLYIRPDKGCFVLYM